eukprot:362823_1
MNKIIDGVVGINDLILYHHLSKIPLHSLSYILKEITNDNVDTAQVKQIQYQNTSLYICFETINNLFVAVIVEPIFPNNNHINSMKTNIFPLLHNIHKSITYNFSNEHITSLPEYIFRIRCYSIFSTQLKLFKHPYLFICINTNYPFKHSNQFQNQPQKQNEIAMAEILSSNKNQYIRLQSEEKQQHKMSKIKSSSRVVSSGSGTY